VMHILIPQDSSDAQISLTYGKGEEGREDQSYSGIVIHHTKDMISIVCKSTVSKIFLMSGGR